MNFYWTSFPSASQRLLGCAASRKPPVLYNVQHLRSNKLDPVSLEDSANLPDPDVIAEEIAEDLQAALVQFEEILSDLRK